MNEYKRRDNNNDNLQQQDSSSLSVRQLPQQQQQPARRIVSIQNPYSTEGRKNHGGNLHRNSTFSMIGQQHQQQQPAVPQRTVVLPPQSSVQQRPSVVVGVKIQNPYTTAKKKERNNVSAVVDVNSEPQQQQYSTSNNNPTANTRSNMKVVDENNTNKEGTPLGPQQQQPNAAASTASKPMPPSTYNSRTSINNTSNNTYFVPYWQRLPSRNLSFESAEILTVTECIQHAALYHNRAVRVTGVLHHRRFLPAANDRLVVQLELMDPLLPPSIVASQQKKRKATNLRQRSSMPSEQTSTVASLLQSFKRSRPSTSSLSSVHKNRPSTSNLARSATKSLSLSSRNPSKPWFGNNNSLNNNNNNNNNNLVTTGRRKSASLGGGGGGMLRRPPRLSTTNNTKAPPTTTSAPKILKVLVDPSMPRLDQAVLGSMVMIIGTIVVVDDANAAADNQGENSSRPGLEVLNDVTTGRSLFDEEEEMNTQETIIARSSSSSPPPVPDASVPPTFYKVEARILQVLPQADLTLFGAALNARRKALYQRYHHHQQQEDTNNDDGIEATSKEEYDNASTEEESGHETRTLAAQTIAELPQVLVPIQGCGPPPYTRFLS